MRNVQENENRRYEIAGVIFIAVAVLTALSVYFNIISTAGEAISFCIFGVLGVVGYVFPVISAVIGVMFIMAKRDLLDAKKIALVILLFFLALSLLHIYVAEMLNTGSFIEFTAESFDLGAAFKSGGGFIGALIAYPLYCLLGTAGSYIVLIAAIAVSVLALTNLSIKRMSTGIGHAVKTQHDKFVEYREEARMRKNRQDLYVIDLARTNEADQAEYNENPFDIRIDSDDNTVNVRKVYRRKPKAKTPEKPESDGFGYTIDPNEDSPFKKENEEFVQDSLDLYNDGVKATEKVKQIKSENAEKDLKPDPKPGSRKKDSTSTARRVGVGVVPPKKNPPAKKSGYVFPPLSLLNSGEAQKTVSAAEKKNNAATLEDTLADFGIAAKVEGISVGPVITRYEVKPAAGVSVKKIVNLSDDIALAFATPGVRIEAPIPGKAAVGIEVPNSSRSNVALRDLLSAPEFRKSKSSTVFAVGKDIAGKNIYADIRKMPHLLIAGETNSGKSVCVNSLIMSLLYNASPDDVKMIMIDPKQVELSEYNNIPHLLIPVVTNIKKAPAALQWAVNEMHMRYKMLSANGVKELVSYNEKMVLEGKDPLPKLIIIIDEVAELMMTSPKEVEEAICSIAQLGRAAGIHLVVATQRPSVQFITGAIKANIPSRIAFSVASQTDSRTILDRNGAEKLIGRGDMLFLPTGSPKPMRVQGCFVTEEEIKAVCDFLRQNVKHEYDESVAESIEASNPDKEEVRDDGDDEYDALFPQAVKLVLDSGQASISMIQRRFRVGYARAARLIDEMEIRGYVSGFEGSKARQVLITKEEYNEIFGDVGQQL